ncbi:hypothetical protein ACU686_03390 [Yinghuangia aomiensis]
MSPELHATLASGDPSTTVYLAAGDLQDMRPAPAGRAEVGVCRRARRASAWTKSMRTPREWGAGRGVHAGRAALGRAGVPEPARPGLAAVAGSDTCGLRR